MLEYVFVLCILASSKTLIISIQTKFQHEEPTSRSSLYLKFKIISTTSEIKNRLKQAFRSIKAVSLPPLSEYCYEKNLRISGRGEREGFCGRFLAFSPLPFSQEDHYNRCKDGFNREAEVMKGESKTYPGGDFKLKSEGQGPGMDSFGSPFPALAISWGMGHV
jgi:hypothetical protein